MIDHQDDQYSSCLAHRVEQEQPFLSQGSKDLFQIFTAKVLPFEYINCNVLNLRQRKLCYDSTIVYLKFYHLLTRILSHQESFLISKSII